MSFIKRTLLILFNVFIMIISSSCSKKENNFIDKNRIVIPNYPYTMVGETKGEKINLYRINKEIKEKVGELEYMSDLIYDRKNSVYAYLVHDNKELKKNNIKLISNKGETIISNFYFAKDLQLSSNGKRIAYRSFKNESLDSAEGLSLYNIEENKKINIKSQVLVSGNLYEWIDDDNIIYYGVKDNISAIFKYNVNNDKEETYMENIRGYCMYFKSFEEGILILSRTKDDDNLSFYRKKDNRIINISNNIENIYKGTYDKKNKKMYIIASEVNTDMVALYKIDLETFSMDRINYDFPKFVDKNGGLQIDSDGLVYYCGIDNINENIEHKNEIFMYNPQDGSNNLISINPSKYKIIGSKQE